MIIHLIFSSYSRNKRFGRKDLFWFNDGYQPVAYCNQRLRTVLRKLRDTTTIKYRVSSNAPNLKLASINLELIFYSPDEL